MSTFSGQKIGVVVSFTRRNFVTDNKFFLINETITQKFSPETVELDAIIILCIGAQYQSNTDLYRILFLRLKSEYQWQYLKNQFPKLALVGTQFSEFGS